MRIHKKCRVYDMPLYDSPRTCFVCLNTYKSNAWMGNICDCKSMEQHTDCFVKWIQMSQVRECSVCKIKWRNVKIDVKTKYACTSFGSVSCVVATLILLTIAYFVAGAVSPEISTCVFFNSPVFHMVKFFSWTVMGMYVLFLVFVPSTTGYWKKYDLVSVRFEQQAIRANDVAII